MRSQQQSDPRQRLAPRPPQIAGLGLALLSTQFRTALKYRLGFALYSEPFPPCPALSAEGKTCGIEMDRFGDHAICCHYGPSLLFRHNNVRDILGHSARVASRLWSPKRSTRSKVQRETRRHHGPRASPRVTIAHPLQQKYLEIAMEEAGVAAQDAHDKKLQKSLALCGKEGLHFVPLAWESLGGATETVTRWVGGRWKALAVATQPR